MAVQNVLKLRQPHSVRLTEQQRFDALTFLISPQFPKAIVSDCLDLFQACCHRIESVVIVYVRRIVQWHRQRIIAELSMHYEILSFWLAARASLCQSNFPTF